MDKFEASNGAQIVLTNARQTGYVLVEKDDDVASAYLGFEEMVAWREFFQAERDEELGRWRWPENPDLVVYADEEGDVEVLDERRGTVSSLITRDDVSVRNPSHPATKAAVAYFAAHPERKPWHDAEEGEVWIVTPSKALTLGEKVEYPAIFQAGMFRDHGGSWGADDLTNARRIWPEEA